MNELTDQVHEKITSLSAKGDNLAEKGKYSEALAIYWEAWDLLPEPKTNWDAATWLLVAIGDANFLSEDYVAGKDNLSQAMHCPDAIGNPFIHMRLGQCQLELNNLDRAADELARAYMGGGYEIFEDDDKKYFEFLKTKLDPPPGGWEDENKKPFWKVW